jgi:hypothetical protein
MGIINYKIKMYNSFSYETRNTAQKSYGKLPDCIN